jgi:hypothetical protein
MKMSQAKEGYFSRSRNICAVKTLHIEQSNERFKALDRANLTRCHATVGSMQLEQFWSDLPGDAEADWVRNKAWRRDMAGHGKEPQRSTARKAPGSDGTVRPKLLYCSTYSSCRDLLYHAFPVNKTGANSDGCRYSGEFGARIPDSSVQVWSAYAGLQY